MDFLVSVRKESTLRNENDVVAVKRGYIIRMPQTLLVGQLEPRKKVPMPRQFTTNKLKRNVFALRLVKALALGKAAKSKNASRRDAVAQRARQLVDLGLVNARAMIAAL